MAAIREPPLMGWAGRPDTPITIFQYYITVERGRRSVVWPGAPCDLCAASDAAWCAGNIWLPSQFRKRLPFGQFAEGPQEASRVRQTDCWFDGRSAARGACAAGDARMAVDAPIDMSKHSKTKRFKSR